MLPLLAALVFAFAAVCAPAPALAQAPDPAIARGLKLLRMQGCTACHSLDGSISAGPTFAGRFGKPTRVLVNGKRETVAFDLSYLRTSVEDPSAALSEGYAPGVMPRFVLTDEQLTAIAAALASLGEPPTADGSAEREPEDVTLLALFVLLFVGGHLTLSSKPVRSALSARMGERGFQGIYSLVALLGIGGMIWAYGKAPYVELWPPTKWTRYVPLLVMPIALFFAVCGLTTKTPTQVGQEGALANQQPAVGILRVTRHPQLWAYALFSLAHMPPNGDAAALLLFGGFFALSILGMLHIEQRRAEAHGEAWQRFEAVTSLVPFEAIVEGKNQLVWREIGWWRLLLALALYAGLLFAHSWLFGASPWP